MTITMLVCLLIIAWEKTAGKSKGFHLFHKYNDDHDTPMFVEYCLEKNTWKNKGFHFFQQYDDDYDARMCVDYCREKQLERVRAFTSSSKMMTITMLLCLLNTAWRKTYGNNKGFQFDQ